MIGTIRRVARRLPAGLVRRSRLLGLVAAAVTAVSAAVVARRRQVQALTLPDPAAGTAEAAVSLHNAAKGTVISTVRAADSPDLSLVRQVAREAIADAASSGVDLVPVAIGVTEGAAEIAHLLDRPGEEVAAAAATSAKEAATEFGAVAGSRVRTALAPLAMP